ncbi:MAG: 2-oxoacid:acceptor oxidoreductase subunit alpha [Dehalococcoidia bacterium]
MSNNESKNKQRSATVGIVGTGGDGVVLAGSLLQNLAASLGYSGIMTRHYGAQIRGGGSAAKISLDAERVSLPEEASDILVCFNWGKYAEARDVLGLEEQTIVFYESEPREETKLPPHSFPVNFSKISSEVTGSERSKNIVAMGLLMAMLGIEIDLSRSSITAAPEMSVFLENRGAFEAGRSLFAERQFPALPLMLPVDSKSKLILHGNAAVARGAVRAGCRAFFGYPITPASEIMQEMAEYLPKEGVFLQAEDEIASAGLVLGSSLTGTPALTATSGPGFDLMTEMMGLAVAAEIPMVIVDVQRGGPSTGIPSKSEQSDLNHAIYGGHGDAPRVVLAPYDVEGCYRLGAESVLIAEHYQTAVILLSDQWLGQTLVATSDEFMTGDYAQAARKKPQPGRSDGYRRYEPAEDFISPMANAGDKETTYQASGLTHNERGAPAFDAETHQQLHQKRWQKLQNLRHRDDLVSISGAGAAKAGIISWGSSAQLVWGAICKLGIEDKVKLCIPEIIYPLPEGMMDFVDSLDRLLVIEMNYSGQLYHYLRAEISLPADTSTYTRAGGDIFSIDELSAPIKELIL